MKFRTKMLEALRNDAEAAADAIDEALQQLNVLNESIRDTRCCTVEELEQATGLARATLRDIVDGANPPIRSNIDLPVIPHGPDVRSTLDRFAAGTASDESFGKVSSGPGSEGVSNAV